MSLRVLHGVPKLLTITIGPDRGSERTGSRKKSEDHREIGNAYSDIFPADTFLSHLEGTP